MGSPRRSEGPKCTDIYIYIYIYIYTHACTSHNDAHHRRGGTGEWPDDSNTIRIIGGLAGGTGDMGLDDHQIVII